MGMKTGAKIDHFAEDEVINIFIKALNRMKLTIIPKPVNPLALRAFAPLMARS